MLWAYYGAGVAASASTVAAIAECTTLTLGACLATAMPYIVAEVALLVAQDLLFLAAADPVAEYAADVKPRHIALRQLEQMEPGSGRDAAEAALAFLSRAEALADTLPRLEGAREARHEAWPGGTRKGRPHWHAKRPPRSALFWRNSISTG